MESSLKPARLPKTAATATPTTTPTAVKTPCQVTSMPATSNSWGSRPIFIASRTALSIILLPVLLVRCPALVARHLRHLLLEVHQVAGVAGELGSGRCYFSPYPPSWHPEPPQQTCQQQPGAAPHQVIAPVPLHLDAGEL